MSAAVRFVVSAQVELLEAVSWYEDKQPGIGLRFNSLSTPRCAGLCP